MGFALFAVPVFIIALYKYREQGFGGGSHPTWIGRTSGCECEGLAKAQG